jgi:hypothetical protein
METLHGNIWRLAEPTDFVVVPTNIGWRKGTTQGIMGAGLAAQARTRWPAVEASWGAHCMQQVNKTSFGGFVVPLLLLTGDVGPAGIILAPTKPLNLREPHRSWQSPSDLELVQLTLCFLLSERQAQALTLLQPEYRVLIPLLGAGHGGIPEAEAEQLIRDEVALAEHRARFFLVKRTAATPAP